MSHAPEAPEADQRLGSYYDSWSALHKLLRDGASFSGHERNCAFLNLGGSRFANVSASTGLDFLDDGRCVSVTDWDHDGDLDLWLHNRSSPRLRFMRNETSAMEGGSGFVAMRLRGTSCNRDGIGARVEVHLKDQSQGRLIQTLFGGDAYLSQSSKWLHFGLGTNPQIDFVTVRWPGGELEKFTDILPDRFYMIEQDSGLAVEWHRPTQSSNFSPSLQQRIKPKQAAHVLLPDRFLMPRLPYTLFDDTKNEQSVDTRSAPLLVNLWASWCQPCHAELQEWTEHHEEIRDAGLNIISLSVDGIGESKGTDLDGAKQFLDQIDFPFDSGAATLETVDKIELVQEILFNWRRTMAVPTSFLLDRKGWIAAIYRGPVSVDILLRDVANLDVSEETRFELAAPYPGHWYQPYRVPIPLFVAQWLMRIGYERDVEPYAQLAIEKRENRRMVETLSVKEKRVRNEQRLNAMWLLGISLKEQGRFTEAEAALRQAVQSVSEKHAALAQFELGHVLVRQGKLGEAARSYQLVLQSQPDSSRAHYNLGEISRSQGKWNEAIRHFRQAVSIDPSDAESQVRLGEVLVNSRNYDEAIIHFKQAVQLDPDDGNTQSQLAVLLIQLGRKDEAINHFRLAFQAQPDNPTFCNNLGSALASQRNLDEAIKYFRKAIELSSHAADPYMNLGGALRLQGKMTEAIRHYERAASIKPDDIKIRYSLGKSLFLHGQAQESIEHLQFALRGNTGSANIHYELAQALRKTGDHEQALRHFREAVRFRPALADAVKQLGVELNGP